MELAFSFVIPVYNRPNEVKELLESLLRQSYTKPFEIVLVEDGSISTSEKVIAEYRYKLDITYLKKENTGPGDSRNFGMRKAKGNYFIILDSDCIVPPDYLTIVSEYLTKEFVHCYGGPDGAHPSFSKIQKAINHTMTSFLTTGGIRGKVSAVNKFQPRSFNMGISKRAFGATQGFGNIHPGEDPDLSFRLWEQGFDSHLISDAVVYHKRRINWLKFYQQVRKFGMVRPILNKWHPRTAKPTYWIPTFFSIFAIIAVVSALWGNFYPLVVLLGYLLAVFIDSGIRNRDIWIALFSIFALLVQFFGYGYGFLLSTIRLRFTKREPQELFPELFFKIISK